MKTTFRQGLARYQADALSTPIFLQKSSTGNFVDLVVAPDPTIIIFAHRSASYVVEEIRSVQRAWGPIGSSLTTYLYWDINLVSGELTRDITTKPPIFSVSPPPNPTQDQHWFDVLNTTMFVWNGNKWVEKIRVFAGWVVNGSIIYTYRLGSQAGITGDFEAGNIVLDVYSKPLRQSDGTFVTTTAGLTIINNSARRVRFEADILTGMATEPIPKYSLVRLAAGRRLQLNHSYDFMSRIAGIVTEDLDQNEVGYVTTDGLIRNEQWSFPPEAINRPVFSGLNGEVTLAPPATGVLQIAGFVYDVDAICVDVQPPIILDQFTELPPAVDSNAPIADFVAAPLSGVAPLTVSFTNQSLNVVTGYEWDFNNDGTVDSLQTNPTHTFATPGVYTVRLRASNSFGFDDEVKLGFITVNSPAPVAQDTNLSIKLTGPSWVRRNGTAQVAVGVSNDGGSTATNVVRTLIIPDVGQTQLQITGLPTGSTLVRNFGRAVITMPTLATVAGATELSPVYITITAPPTSGTILVQANISSNEVDLNVGDNTTSLSIEVRSS